VEEFATVIPFDDASKHQLMHQLEQHSDLEGKIEFLTTLGTDLYNKREEQLSPSLMRHAERFVFLSVIDNLWMSHLDAIDNLRQGIGLRGYAQKDPLVEYKNEGYRMFENLVFEIDDDIVHRIYKIHVEQQDTPHTHPIEVLTNTPETEVSEDVILKQKAKAKEAKNKIPAASKLGRNDPCWCGSGKKYKKCHFPQLPQ
jgi:preprotein translocase subunit SecA